MTEYRHIPVMLKEAIEYLNPQPGGYFIDCTLGGGGYTTEISRRVGENGRVLAIDLDEMAIENFKLIILNLKLENVILIQDNFRNIEEIVKNNFENNNIKFDGIVFDLGLSNAQLEDRKRGISFKNDAPLNMAFGDGLKLQGIAKTKDIVNFYKQEDLERIIREYGEEKYARSIAKNITQERKNKFIETTGELLKIIEKAVPASYKRGRIHFATRTFQALRIETNSELKNLEEALPQALELLKSGGKIVAVSYHSLEDRIVKHFFKKESRGCICPPESPICQCGHQAKIKIITKKAAIPSEEEIINNYSARSAKMRVAEAI